MSLHRPSWAPLYFAPAVQDDLGRFMARGERDPLMPTVEHLTARIARERQRLASANGEAAEELEQTIRALEAMVRKLAQGEQPVR